MQDGIFLIQKGGELLKLQAADYDTEDVLQALLAKYPELIPGEQINGTDPRRWLLIDREVGVPGEEKGGNRWALDHLFVDQDAIPTLIEIKRSSDTRIRREVVGQMLDYAANAVVYWPIEKIRSTFETRCAAEGAEPEEVLSGFLGSEETETFWEQLATNLGAGKVRLLFVADQIPDELKRIVEFLNEQMSPAEVLAVAIPQYVGEGLQTLVPQVIGKTAKGTDRKARRRTGGNKWDEDSFFDAITATRGPEEAGIARELLNWIGTLVSRIWWGEGSQTGSFVPVLEHGGKKHYPFSAWTSGKLEIPFSSHKAKPPFENETLRQELKERFDRIPSVEIPPDKIGANPGIPMEKLLTPDGLAAFKQAVVWYIEQVKRS
ncbi:MAG: hypothetical protein RRB13_06460 [bacterium]|nr:hypothetical protein [bacterium]